MSGFDNGSLSGGVFSQAKQLGSILRGFGPPVPEMGVVGDCYLDTQTWFLYSKRSVNNTDPWGNYLFQLPVAYRTALKWFSAYAPTNDVGIAGDYCLLWGGFNNYGMQPSVYGPKQSYGWPESGDGGTIAIGATGAGGVLQIGLLSEGATLADSSSTQLIVTGLEDEFIIAVPVTANVGDLVQMTGLRSTPAMVPVVINPIYSAENSHTV